MKNVCKAMVVVNDQNAVDVVEGKICAMSFYYVTEFIII
jgi:hypothetical protein